MLDQLEREGERIRRAPLAEALLFLWQEEAAVSKQRSEFLQKETELIERLAAQTGKNGAFSANQVNLHAIADKYLPMTSGGNARYRFAKAVEMGRDSAAVLSLAPRYENAAMVMEMRGLRKAVNVPLMQLSFDGDWDESAWSRLRSFLYYC